MMITVLSGGDYDGTIQTIKLIALKLGVTPCAVKGQIQRMGLAKVKRHAWSPREIERFAELVHQHSIPQVAKILHRSPTAVKVKLPGYNWDCAAAMDGIRNKM
jgi:predicted transcriptional regulator